MAATEARVMASMRAPALILFAAGATLAPLAQADNTVSYQAFKYVESNQRIKVLSGDLSIEKDFGTDYTGHLDIGYDGISGATPCWQTAPAYANQFVSSQCKVAIETRNSIGAGLTWRDAKRNEYRFGASVSHEPDFISNEVSAQAQIWHDAAHNRSYTVGLGLQQNTSVATAFTNNASDQLIHSYSLQAGVNQVLDRSSTVEASVFAGRESGYLSHQYLKIVREDSFGQNTLADDTRPDTRNSAGVALRWIKSWRDDLKTNLWLRYYRDSWGIASATVEAKTFWDLNAQWRINPVLRLFQQGSANFYRGYGDATNTFASSGYGSNDARVGALQAVTAQVNLEYRASKEWSVNTGLSHYTQDSALRANWLTAGFVFRY